MNTTKQFSRRHLTNGAHLNAQALRRSRIDAKMARARIQAAGTLERINKIRKAQGLIPLQKSLNDLAK